MKKIIKTLLVVMVVVLALAAFTACENDPATTTTAPCQHQGGTATCTEQAVCELCGESYGAALGHKAAVLYAIDATCSKEGRTEGSYCKVCNEVLVAQESIEKLEHVWVANEDRDFTCTMDGLVGGNHCEMCGIQDGTIEVVPAQCRWGEPFVYAEPTCTETGIMAVECQVCGDLALHSEIEPLGHTLVDVEGKAATCTEDGYTAHKVCSVCEATDGYEVIPAAHNADENGVCTGCGYVLVETAEELIAALEAGKKVLLLNDIVMDATLKCPYGNSVGVAQRGGELNGNGHTLTVNGSGNYYAIITYGGTIKNLKINAGFRAVVTYTPTEDVVLDNVTIVGDSICYGFNTAEHATLEGIDLVVKNSTICGWVSFDGGFESVSFENCNFVQGTYYNNVVGRLVKPYVSTTFTNCTFVTNAYLDLSTLEAGETVTLVGCKVAGVDVTVDVFTTVEDHEEIPFTYEAPEGVELVLAAVEGGVSFHRHGYVADVTAPTCTAAGKTVYTCACGHTYEEAGEAATGHADEDGNFKCDRCSTKMLPADGTTLTIPQAIEVAKLGGSAYTTQKYYITGIVTNVYNTTYGNLYLKDAEGNQICIYGLYTWDKAVRYDKMEYKPVEGDELTVYTVLGTYNSTPQGKDAWMDDVVAHEHDYKSVVTDPGCLTEGYTTDTCSICGTSNVHSTVEALGHTTDAGECERCGAVLGGDEPVVGTLAEFTFGANGTASHADPSSKFSNGKSYTVNGYTLKFTSATNCYDGGRDAKGNSCMKMGTSSAAGSFTVTVPDNVTEVVIYVAQYKANTTKISVNGGAAQTITTASNNGAYTAIVIDTSVNKTFTFATVSGGVRCMIDTIVFNGTVN